MSPTKSNRLTKAETVGLWHAVNNSGFMLRALEETKPAPEVLETERRLLADAKRGLRKVNALRKQGL